MAEREDNSLPPIVGKFADVTTIDKGEPTTTTESKTQSCAVGSLYFRTSASAKLQILFHIHKFIVMKSELFAQILSLVAQTTELTPEQILSKIKTDDLVAARSLFVHHCAALGLPSVSIASFMHRRKTNSVNRYLAAYQSFYKSSYYFREMDSHIASSLSPHLSRN